MRVISNTSPIIGLLSVNRLHLLSDMFDEVIIPRAVHDELFHPAHISDTNADELCYFMDDKAISVYTVINSNAVEHLLGRLHRGELEVIIGAKELGIELAVIDEIAARKLADQFMLNTIGILGIMSLAKKRGLIDSVKPEIDALRKNGYRISERLYLETLSSNGEQA